MNPLHRIGRNERNFDAIVANMCRVKETNKSNKEVTSIMLTAIMLFIWQIQISHTRNCEICTTYTKLHLGIIANNATIINKNMKSIPKLVNHRQKKQQHEIHLIISIIWSAYAYFLTNVRCLSILLLLFLVCFSFYIYLICAHG